jgi:hypothetical protein
MNFSFDLRREISSLLASCICVACQIAFNHKKRRQMKSVSLEEALKQKGVKRTVINKDYFYSEWYVKHHRNWLLFSNTEFDYRFPYILKKEGKLLQESSTA